MQKRETHLIRGDKVSLQRAYRCFKASSQDFKGLARNQKKPYGRDWHKPEPGASALEEQRLGI